jgi:hypothetical protein
VTGAGGSPPRREIGVDDVIEHFTLDDGERELLRNKSGSTRLGFAAMLKFLSWKGRFPRGRFELPDDVIEHLARQVKVPPVEIGSYDFVGRQIKNHRREIRNGPPRVNARDPTVCICRRPPRQVEQTRPSPTRFYSFAGLMCPERLRPRGQARAGHVGDDGARCCSRWCRRRAPPHARNAASPRPKGDGDKRKALLYAQLLSEVRVDSPELDHVARHKTTFGPVSGGGAPPAWRSAVRFAGDAPTATPDARQRSAPRQ